MYMVPFHSNNLLDDSDLFDTFGSLFKNLDSLSRIPNVMKTDIAEKNGNVEMIMDLPGVKKKDIQIKLKKGNLIISAFSDDSKSTEEHSKDRNYIRKERHSGKYTRSFYVGENISHEDIKARFENGTLCLTFPKEKPKQEPESNFIDIE